MQSSGSMALYSSPLIPGKERTTAVFPSVMELGQQLQICLKSHCDWTLNMST